LVVTIFVIAAAPVCAQAQKPTPADEAQVLSAAGRMKFRNLPPADING
jgi:hypothetical protein